jgi:hypothetical protein
MRLSGTIAGGTRSVLPRLGLVLVLLLAGCGDDRTWNHPCDPTHGTMIPVDIDMLALHTDCAISTETGPIELPSSYIYCGKCSQHGWCVPFLDFKIDSMYNLQRDINGDLPDRIIEATLNLNVICKGGGKVDVLVWRDRESISYPSDIDVPSDSWWKLASFTDNGTLERNLALDLSTAPLDWLLNGSAGPFAGIILFPSGSRRGPDWDEGHWIISTVNAPHLHMTAVRERN